MSDYVAPWVTPEECDHEDYEDADGVRWSFCTHCCPCPDCGAERALDEEGAPTAATVRCWEVDR